MICLLLFLPLSFVRFHSIKIKCIIFRTSGISVHDSRETFAAALSQPAVFIFSRTLLRRPCLPPAQAAARNQTLTSAATVRAAQEGTEGFEEAHGREKNGKREKEMRQRVEWRFLTMYSWEKKHIGGVWGLTGFIDRHLLRRNSWAFHYFVLSFCVCLAMNAITEYYTFNSDWYTFTQQVSIWSSLHAHIIP